MVDDTRSTDLAEGPSGRRRSVGALRLMVIHEQGATTHPLPAAGSVTLGRASQADIVLDDSRVSRVHCSLFMGDSLTVTDMGSANGTRVRGRRLSPGETFALRPGDVIEVGDSSLVLQSPVDLAPSWRPSAEQSGPVTGMRAQVIVDDEVMRRLHDLLARVAQGVISVLLLGATGVGKEIFAEQLHRLSPRSAGPFLRLNCAALSESLLESELFGHERGAFTGAVQAKPGLLESAHGGTVFLDEVGELPPMIQVKLLRVIEERRVTRVGGLQPRSIDVRFVAATHRDLEDLIRRERFRQDLYFRLNGISLLIPPLRERPRELPALAALFAAESCARAGLGAAPALSSEALEALLAHPWPGNLRELRNVMERAVLLTDHGVIEPRHLGLDGAPTGTARPGDAPVADAGPRAEGSELERRRIIEALEQCAGNQTRTAEALGISRRTLVTRLTQFQIARPRKRGSDD